MYQYTLRTDWLQAKRRITDGGDEKFYDLKFVAFPVILDASSDLSQEQRDVQSLLTPATIVGTLMARIRVFNARRNAAQEIQQQKEAISTWEDEGGSAIKPLSIRPVLPR